jgi:hypothetical protein
MSDKEEFHPSAPIELTESDKTRLELIRKKLVGTSLPTFLPLLPLAFNWEGKPYHLDDHFPFEPFFNCNLPEQMCVIGGRQIAKTTSTAAKALAVTTMVPYFSTLYLAPLQEQSRRFSSQYVGKFLSESPMRHFWMDTKTQNNVQQRSFRNFSRMFFSFATLTAERIRGIPANWLIFDEMQNFDPSLLPVIKEVLSHSRVTDPRTGKVKRFRMMLNTGTPKTLSTALHKEWQRSSQAEWIIRCTHCRKHNVPRRGEDLEKMIGPLHDDIGEARDGKKPATICAKCGQSIDPRSGYWQHMLKERMYDYPGYHIPQIIMPIHYADKKYWAKLRAKQEGAENFTTAKFYNEVLGESYDLGSRLVTETHLKRAGTLPWKNNIRDWSIPRSKLNDYIIRILGVDWGGGGDEEVSFTTAAVVGMRPDGRLDVIYGERLLTPNEEIVEADKIMRIYRAFQCEALAHDYNGAGALRETFIKQAGMDSARIVPLVYNRTANKDMMVFHKAELTHHRTWYHLDKARSLQLICSLIKLQQIRFFEFDYLDADSPGLMYDFLGLIENKTETQRAGEVYNIHRMANMTDDFAHSVNFACCSIWHSTKKWPNLPKIAKFALSEAQQEVWEPTSPWRDIDIEGTWTSEMTSRMTSV